MLRLQEMANQGQQFKVVTLNERLPPFLIAPCHLNVTYQVTVEEDFFLMHLHVQGNLIIECQRCLHDFNFLYNNKTVVAVCGNDDRAEQVLGCYECIVSANLQVSLEDMLIDELHLYSPQSHTAINDCNNEINQILGEKSKFY